MARRPAKPDPAPIGARLPPDWREASSWRIWPMIYGVPEAEYATVARAFEASTRGRLSGDWMEEWKAWCRAELLRRFEASRVTVGLFG
jgi:hypothetical protein